MFVFTLGKAGFCEGRLQVERTLFTLTHFWYIRNRAKETWTFHKARRFQMRVNMVCYCMEVTEAKIIEHVAVRRCCSTLADIQRHTGANTGTECETKNPGGV